MTTTITKRTDIHRPSAIEPSDYYFVALGYQKCEGLEDVYAIAENQRRLRDHMDRTGAKFSRHRHAGNCHICGAHCIYTVIFHHEPTNTLIITGMDCAEKMDMCDSTEFRTFRDSIKAAEHNRAGKAKAKAILESKGLSRAWELSLLETDPTTEPAWKCKCGGRNMCCENCAGLGTTSNSWGILCDVVNQLVRYGNISDKQMEFLRKLVDTVDRWDEIVAEREAKKATENATAEDCPEGRHTITGTVLSTRGEEGAYGWCLKMLVKDDRGFKVWGNAPSSLQLLEVPSKEEVEAKDVDQIRNNGHKVEQEGDKWIGHFTVQRGLDKGDRVTFTATITPSKDDDKFGFFKRPTKAKAVYE